MQVEEHRLTVAGGIAIHVVDYNPASSGLPMVCLHGLTRNSRDFAGVAPWLADQGHRVIVPDMRGRGRSDYDPEPANYQPLIYAQDVISVLAQLGVTRAAFIGTSMGGIITALLFHLRPDLVAGVVLNDIGPEASAEGLQRIADFVGKPVPTASWTDAEDYLRRINGSAYPEYSPEDWARFARQTFREDGGVPRLDYDANIAVPIAAASAERLIPPPWWELLDAIAANGPLLILRGAHSDILSPETAARMAATGAQPGLVEIAGVGHAPTLDEPDSRDALSRWLELLPSS